MTIAIHQPNYLPWLGYFYKIYASDIFVFHDNVAYSKRSLTKRCQIRKAKGSMEKAYLTVPLEKHQDGTLIKDLKIDHSQSWIKRQLNLLRNTYSKAPFFDQNFLWLESHLKEVQTMAYLAEGNIYLIKQTLELLGINRNVYQSSELPVSGYKSVYNLNIINHFGAKVYLSGSGAKKYQSEEDFKTRGVELNYHNFLDYHKTHAYVQMQGGYLHGLSIIDALFNLGVKNTISLFKIYTQLDQ